MRSITWPQVALVAVVVCVVGALTYAGKDPTPVVGLILALLGGALYGEVRQVKEQTNGAQSALLHLIREQSKVIAASNPPKDGTDGT